MGVSLWISLSFLSHVVGWRTAEQDLHPLVLWCGVCWPLQPSKLTSISPPSFVLVPSSSSFFFFLSSGWCACSSSLLHSGISQLSHYQVTGSTLTHSAFPFSPSSTLSISLYRQFCCIISSFLYTSSFKYSVSVFLSPVLLYFTAATSHSPHWRRE